MCCDPKTIQLSSITTTTHFIIWPRWLPLHLITLTQLLSSSGNLSSSDLARHLPSVHLLTHLPSDYHLPWTIFLSISSKCMQVCKLFTIPFQFTWAKNEYNCLFI
jgi:hypothetical protein